jgi:Transcriptional Coactivator p15 (PC4)
MTLPRRQGTTSDRPGGQAYQQLLQDEQLRMERLLAELLPQDDTAVHALLREPPASGDRVLARLDKSATEEIRLARSRYKAKEVVDIRIFYLDATTQTWKPTKKGIAFVVEHWRAFYEAVLQADQRLRQAGDIR